MDGSYSYDKEDGVVNSYFWTIIKPDGINQIFKDAKFNYVVDQAGKYIISLMVTDSQQAIGQTSTTITVTEAPVCGNGIVE